MIESIFLRIIDMSLLSTYCIAFVILIRLFLRKSPKIFSYLLWIAVFARLVLPVIPESPVSLVPQAIGNQSVNAWMDKDQPAAVSDTPTRYNPISEESLNNPNSMTVPDEPSDAISWAATESAHALSLEITSISVPQILSWIWAIGIVTLLFYNLGTYIYLKRKLRSAIHIEGIVYEVKSVTSPFLLGFFRPKIYLPSGLDDTNRAYILRHEQVHIQRKDYIFKAVFFAITCIHWFNPLVWLAFGLMSRDMEMSCDEKVIRELGYDIKKHYSTSLLSLATGRSLLHATPLAFGEGSIKGRIKNVLQYKKPAIWIILGSAFLVGLVVVGLMLNPPKLKKAAPTSNLPTEETAPTTSDSTSSTDAAEPSVSQSDVPETSPSMINDTPIVLDEKYDNAYINIDGEPISFRDVLSMGDYHPFEYFSPLDYRATTPVDLSNFGNVVSNSGYFSISSLASYPDAYISAWEAIGPDGKDRITCLNFPTEEAANLAITEFAVNYHYNYVNNNPDELGAPLEIISTESSLIMYDASNFTSEGYFVIQYLSGNSVIQAKVFVETQRLQQFFYTMDDLGLAFPGIELNRNENSWPEKATLVTPEVFLEYFDEFGYDTRTNTNIEGSYHAESEDLMFQADYTLLSDIGVIDWYYLWNVTSGLNPNFDYFNTDTYEMFVLGDSQEYVVQVFIEDIQISAWATLAGLSEEDAAAKREEVDTAIMALCF